MRNELVVKSRGLKGTSDLTLLAPIRPGLVPSLEVVTYKTRVKRLMKTLNMGRSSSHEYALLRPVSDAVERVRVIHSFRVMVLEPENKILLAVTFDGTWESYIRILWQKVGTLLDVIFCNSDGYVTAAENGFEAWCAWVRRVQVETEFFYSTPGFTGDDFYYLREAENLHQRCPANKDTDLAAARLAWNSVEQQAWNTARHLSPLALAETARQGFQALSVLHRLTYMYVPGTPDGAVLQRAAREILLEFVRLAEDTSVFQGFVYLGRKRFDEQISWLLGSRTQRPTPPLPAATPPYPAAEVQGGIINGYADVGHGALLLLAFDDATSAAAWLRELPVDNDGTRSAAARPTVNLALTHEGLRLLGLSEAELALFPQEFREGMEARAGMLGDLRGNHPRRWRLPQRHGGAALVELNTVHAVLQLRGGATQGPVGDDIFADGHPLRETAERWARQAPGVRLLAVQTMLRQRNAQRRIVEHFGFVDDDSNNEPPTSPAQRGDLYDGQLRLGEILCGHDNEGDFAAELDPAPLAWLHNGSFLVVRKLRQDVAAFNQAVAAATSKSLPRKTVLAKMMGRTLEGDPLVAPDRRGGDFDYGDDPEGRLCPFQAHIRRANPRIGPDSETPLPRGGRQARILRRGMAYGPPAATGMVEDDKVDRGLVFMAYNARISEQFEVIQRWLAGGNSSGIFSGAADPLLGVPEDGRSRVFRFEHNNKVHRITLDGSTTPMADPKPFVRLEWGMYLFVPSLPVIRRLAERAAAARPLPPWSAAAGERQIQTLLALQQEPADLARAWKTLLEDHESQEKFVAAGVWAAIREHHGGALRTPYGVLVASHELVVRALHAPAQQLSVRGYQQRLEASIGKIYLGEDDTGPDCPYREQSAATNQAITAITREQGFALARGLTAAIVQGFVKAECDLTTEINQPRWELSLNAKEVFDRLLAGLCEAWFGLESTAGSPLVFGATRWDWQPGQPATYPGHFTAPSRYTFQPRPEPLVDSHGRSWGQALTASMQAFVQQRLDAGVPPQYRGAAAPVAAAIFAAFPGDAAQLARTMVGAIMGFVPTLDGNLKLTLNEWLRDGTFWTLRQTMQGVAPTLAEAERCLGRALRQAMQLRPSPELIWRTAVNEHRLGPLTLQPGETVVLALVSATQQSLAAGDDDLYPIFGGNRRATAAPTHACPAYDAALGVLLGTFTALLQVPQTLRPSPAPLAFTLEGLQDTKPVVLPRPLPVPNGDTAPTRWLIADGDSWFDDWGRDGVDPTMDLVRALRLFGGWGVDELADAGDSLEQIASPAQLQQFSRRLRRMVALHRPPRAVLLSGGGNDVVGAPLVQWLNPFQPGQRALNDKGLDLIQSKLQGHVETAVQHYLAACDAALPKGHAPVPVLLHGYDRPVPDGRGPYGIESDLLSWLKPWLACRGYHDEHALRAAHELIDELNNMLATVAGLERFQGRVFYVNLRGTLCCDPADPRYRDDWENELHPTEAGFVKLAAVLAQRLDSLCPLTTPAAARPPAANASASPSK